MSPEEWKNLAYRKVTVEFGYRKKLNLGELLGYGGSGAVFAIPDFPNPGENNLVIKVLDPDSQIMQQELRSLNKFRSAMRFERSIMKFRHWQGELTFEDRKFPCYVMQKGESLAKAVAANAQWLYDPLELMRLMAFMVGGICSLRNTGLSHGDIKEDNILLVAYKETFFPMFSDYGTVSERETAAKSNHAFKCEPLEYKSELEKRVAYDLHCLYEVFCRICKIEDGLLFPETLDRKICKLLRIMRNQGTRAFDRLQNLMDELKEQIYVPVSFFLDAVPTYRLEEDFPFETVMEWDGHRIVRDKNVPPGEQFDPLLLMKIPSGRYETVYDILASCDRLEDFVMPICRYMDKDGNEYVLIHAPDDARNVRLNIFLEKRIQDSGGIPCTLEAAHESSQRNIITDFSRVLVHYKVNIEFSAENIWRIDRKWKMNLFSVNFLEKADKTAKRCRILWM